jgi:hypothetical protein
MRTLAGRNGNISRPDLLKFETSNCADASVDSENFQKSEKPTICCIFAAKYGQVHNRNKSRPKGRKQ